MGGSIGSGMEICEISGLPIPMVPCLHQSNVYMKSKLQVWRAQKCIVLVGAETVLTSAGLQTTPFHGWQYRAENGNMRNFGPTNPHGTAFAPKQWLYQRVWRDQKCIALVGAETVLTSTGQQTTPFHGGSTGPEMEICETSGLPIPMVLCFHKRNVYIKRKLRVLKTQKCIALVRGKIPLTCSGLQTTPFHGWQYRAENGNM